MEIVIRTDASVHIGSGHVFRCLSLARGLKENGHNCLFICRELKGHLAEKIKNDGHEVTLLQHVDDSTISGNGSDDLYSQWLGVSWHDDSLQTIEVLKRRKCDWLIVDHYGLDHKWESALRDYTENIFVIDDLANRKHNCDLLLDQNLGATKAKYESLVHADCVMLTGPKFALLRPEFSIFRDHPSGAYKKSDNYNILISFGGVDKLNATGKVLDALANTPLSFSISLDIVMGSSAIHLEDVRRRARQLPFHASIALDVENMAERMSRADLAIGAAGSTSWERCCLGLFSFVMIVAENQRDIAEALVSKRAALMLESDDRISSLPAMLEKFFDEDTDREKIRNNVSNITDGYGVKRVVSQMVS